MKKVNPSVEGWRVKQTWKHGAIVFLMVTAAWTGPARAELLYFKEGGRLHSPAVVTEGMVRIPGITGEYVFPVGDFLKIVPGHDPESDWTERREKALKAGVEQQFAAAWWALENGLVEEASGLIRSIHSANPSLQPTATLASLLEKLDAPWPDPAIESLSKALRAPLKTKRSAHILLLHQLGERQAEEQVHFLERIVTAFYLVFGGQGLELEIPSEKLVFVILRRQDDYISFLRSQHAGAYNTTYGYYHPAFNAVVTFDLNASKPLASIERTSLNDDPGKLPESDPAIRGLQRRKLLREMELFALSRGTAAHELVHLLTSASKLAHRTESFPLWLHEGLAAQYEVVRGKRWAGVGRAHDIRLSDWRKIQDSAAIHDVIVDKGLGHGYKAASYARAWGLVYFLRKTRPDKFNVFLRELNETDRSASTFASVFGPPDSTLDAEWRRFLGEVRTPLEENAP